MKEVSIVIPALNPDEKFLKLLDKLIDNSFEDIIVIDDGSKNDTKKYFEIAEQKGCKVLRHAVNLGKGRALKTAFNYFLNNKIGYKGVVTVDADGQHEIRDIINCTNALMENPDDLILGCRDFNRENIPFRSRFGNKMTRSVFNMLVGIEITDTQTGLRAIPTNYIKKLLNVFGERFEYETNMLLETKNNDITIREVTIDTIYIEENKSSHFNPLIDSFKIYKLFFKFLFSSMSSFIVDIALFSVFSKIIKENSNINTIITATVMARIISSLYNYSINKNAVFKSNEKTSSTLLKYFSLSILIMILSALGVNLIHKYISFGTVGVKIVVDTILFLLSFKIQRDWVFRRKK